MNCLLIVDVKGRIIETQKKNRLFLVAILGLSGNVMKMSVRMASTMTKFEALGVQGCICLLFRQVKFVRNPKKKSQKSQKEISSGNLKTRCASSGRGPRVGRCVGLLIAI